MEQARTEDDGHEPAPAVVLQYEKKISRHPWRGGMAITLIGKIR